MLSAFEKWFFGLVEKAHGSKLTEDQMSWCRETSVEYRLQKEGWEACLAQEKQVGPELGDLLTAARGMDWGQVVANGGPPCFHLERGARFCGRAHRWPGHREIHEFVPLDKLITSRTVPFPDLYGWLGEDELGRSPGLGLKQGMEIRRADVPAGALVPMVAVRRDRMEKYWPTAETQALTLGKPISLVRYQAVEVLRVTGSKH